MLRPQSANRAGIIAGGHRASRRRRFGDRGHKLRAYACLPSLRHQLIVWPEIPRVVHHSRAADGGIVTAVFTEGDIPLDPPGISIAVAALCAD